MAGYNPITQSGNISEGVNVQAPDPVSVKPVSEAASDNAMRRTKPSAQAASYQVGATGEIPLGWVLPIVGMGSDSWSRGSFGYQKPASKGGHVHNATDIYMPRGSQIVSSVGGTVVGAGKGDISGNYVRVRGDDGITYYYAHMDQAPNVARGQRINAGASLGVVGNSGNASGTSTHLHFSMKRGSAYINPSEFLATGKQQEFSPMSAITGVNTVAEMDAWIRDQIARTNAAEAVYQDRNMGGMDQAMMNAMADPDYAANAQKIGGQQMLGTVMDQLSRKVAGGDRTPMTSKSPFVDEAGALEPGSAIDSTDRADVSVQQMRERTPEPERKE